jgi:RHS repeat-associated protein
MTDNSGNTVAQYQYDAWGNVISQSGTMASSIPYRYAGYQYDQVTGLYYLMARYYDPNLGRFITKDSIEGRVEDPITFNKYLYVLNNPLVYSDPTGHWEASDISMAPYMQTKILLLTKAWYSATTVAQRTAISHEAQAI